MAKTKACKIENGRLCVAALEEDDKRYLELLCREKDGSWRTVLAPGVVANRTFYSLKSVLLCEDPFVEWQADRVEKAAGFFSNAGPSLGDRALILHGEAGGHRIEQAITLADADRVHVTVRYHVAGGRPIRLRQLMNHIYFVPDRKVGRAVEPLELAWLPALHKKAEHVCADHFFRSPAAIVQAEGFYAALIPDLDLFAQCHTVSHALDLRTTETMIEAPRLSYGLCPAIVDGHVYFQWDEHGTEVLPGTELCYAFDLLFGPTESPEETLARVTSFLWATYGHRTFEDVRPQVLPYEEYGRRYTYAHELPRSVRWVKIGDAECAGIYNPHRRGANFHAWENDLQVGYGVKHYAAKWQDGGLQGVADGILRLILSAPQKDGAFPCIYNFDEGA